MPPVRAVKAPVEEPKLEEPKLEEPKLEPLPASVLAEQAAGRAVLERLRPSRE